MSKELRTYLIQRLNAPIRKTGRPIDSLLKVFGGGDLKLSKEAWDLLSDIFSFDYMGSAEFEFGAVPKALKALAQDSQKLCKFSMIIKGKDIKPNWWRPKGDTTRPVDREVYAICRQEHKDYVIGVLKELAKESLQLKESSYFSYALDPVEGKSVGTRTKGWLELDNGFFFFIDKDMWRRVQAIFGLEEQSNERIS